MADASRRNTGAPVLEVSGLNVYYGGSHALQGVDLTLPGGVVSVVGRNGMGKTTLCKAIMGLVPSSSGSIRFNGTELRGKEPAEIARLGIGYVPQGRRLWRSLTVDEHLKMVAGNDSGAWSVDRIYSTFPRLGERKNNGGGQLSGGEQQMLAIARILRTGAELLLLDEPSEGLAPTIVAEIAAAITDLKSRGFSILLVEQNFHFACDMADRFYIMEEGEIIEEIGIEEVKTKEKMIMEKLTL